METYQQKALAKDLNTLQRQLEAEKRRFSSLTPVQRVAELLHDRLCRSEHPGSCDWEQETWGQNRPDSDHGTYLRKAKALLEVAEDDEQLAIRILEALFV